MRREWGELTVHREGEECEGRQRRQRHLPPPHRTAATALGTRNPFNVPKPPKSHVKQAQNGDKQAAAPAEVRHNQGDTHPCLGRGRCLVFSSVLHCLV